MQDCSNSSALAMELLQFGIKPSVSSAYTCTGIWYVILLANDVSFTYKVLTKVHILFYTNSYLPRKQSSWGQHGTHLGPVGPRRAPCSPHEPCYQGYPSFAFQVPCHLAGQIRNSVITVPADVLKAPTGAQPSVVALLTRQLNVFF